MNRDLYKKEKYCKIYKIFLFIYLLLLLLLLFLKYKIFILIYLSKINNVITNISNNISAWREGNTVNPSTNLVFTN